MEKIRPSEIDALKPIEVVENPKIEGRFVNVVNKMTRSDMGAQIFAREQQWFKRIMTESPDLMKCTPISIFSAFMDVATLGLSVAKGSKPLAYLIPYNVTVYKGTPDEYTEKRMQLEVSPYGELAMRINFRQVQHVDNPVIVYEHEIDGYRDYFKAGKRVIDFERKVFTGDRRKIYCGFIRIVRMDGSVDFFSMDMGDTDRLASYSEKKNKGKGANKLYSSNNGQIDEGFFMAKIIKHAFNTLPKSQYMQFLSNTVLQTEKDEMEDLADLTTLSDDKPENTVEDGVATDITEESY